MYLKFKKNNNNEKPERLIKLSYYKDLDFP